MYYEDIFRGFEEYDVKYVVIGGVAVILYGALRLTGDLDLIISLEPSNIDCFIDAARNLGYQPRVPVQLEEFKDPEKRKKWKLEKGMKAFSIIHPKKPMSLVDIFLDEPIDFRKIDEKKEIFYVEGIKIPVISLQHLRQLKLEAGRPQDLADIEALEELEKLRKKKDAKRKKS